VLYESFINPLTILSTLPSAGIGALCLQRLLRRETWHGPLFGVLIGQFVEPAIRRMPMPRSSTARSRTAPSRFSSMFGHLGADHAA
jgi:hypothetical protein